MLFLALLLTAYVLTWTRPALGQRDRWRLALGAAMVVAGVLHLVQPAPFLQHLPTWVPQPELVVAASGVAEIVLGAGLVVPSPWRRTAGVLLALFLVAVFPANVHVAVSGVEVDGQPGGVYPWVRLAFQPSFVWLAWWSTRAPADDRVDLEGPDDRVDHEVPA